MAYLDDILIYNRTEKEHLEMLDNAFKCLLTARLKIELGKQSFERANTLFRAFSQWCINLSTC